MPNSANRNKVRPWKNSLLNKESDDLQQIPANYFSEVIRDTDAFSFIMEDIEEHRKNDDIVTYVDPSDGKIHSLNAFMVIQDKRGAHWVCPIDTNSEPIDQKIRPVYVTRDESDEFFEDQICLSDKTFGSIVITRTDYLSACSRGFENASLLLLGNESVTLDTDNRLVAAYYIFPKNQPV